MLSIVTIIIGVVIAVAMSVLIYVKYLSDVFRGTKKAVEFSRQFSPAKIARSDYFSLCDFEKDYACYKMSARSLKNYRKQIESADFRYSIIPDENCQTLCDTVDLPVILKQKKCGVPLGRRSFKGRADTIIAEYLKNNRNMTYRYDFGRLIISDNAWLNDAVSKMREQG